MSKEEKYKRCWKCNGTGRTSRLQSYGAFNNWVDVDCRDCDGKGKIKELSK